MSKRRFARIILIDGPMAEGPGHLGWITASVAPAGAATFTATTGLPNQPGMMAAHEYELLPQREGEEQRARWVRLVEIRPMPQAIATKSGIPEWSR